MTTPQGNTNPRPSSGELHAARLELAKVDFQAVEKHLQAVEAKARTLLTVNSLLIGAGVLTAVRALSDSSLGICRDFLVAGPLVVLLVLVTQAFSSLMGVFKVAEFQGNPSATTNLERFQDDSIDDLRESLAKYYADAADKNRLIVDIKADQLERSVKLTQRAFTAFILTVGGLLLTALI